MSSGWLECELCEIVGMPTQIARALVEWRDPEAHGGNAWASIRRCYDHQGCRDRYETDGKRWPVEDATVPTLPRPIKVVGPVAGALTDGVEVMDPVAAAAGHEADIDEEAAAWLLA